MFRKTRSFPENLSLLIVVATGVAVRLYSAADFRRPGGGYFFYNPDSYDHLRHITLWAHRFPSISLHDTYVGYPVGTGHIWAPLYDYLFAALARGLGLDRASTEALCFYSAPVLYGVGILLLYAIARRFFASAAGALAGAVVFTFHPALISYTLPMNFDHHVLEPIICLLFIALPLLEEDDSFRPTRLLLAVALFVGSLFFWRGSTVFWGLSFGAVLLRVVCDGRRRLALSYARLYLLAALLLALYCLFDPLGLRRGVSLVLISWFHPLLLAGCAATLAVVATVSRQVLVRRLLPALGGAALLIPLTPLAPFLHKFTEAAQFMFGMGDPWLSTINELKGTFTTWGFLDGVQYLTAGFLIAPVAVVLALLRWRRHHDPLLLHLVAWYPLVLLAFVYRYALYSAVVVALTTAGLTAFLRLRLAGGKRLACTLLLVAVTCGPSLPLVWDTMHAAIAPEVRYGLLGPGGVVEWIRGNTPPTSHYLDPDDVPEYGILADWDLGSYLYYEGERPALATPFGWETHGFFEHAAFFATGSPERAMAIAAANRIRYVMATWNRSQQDYYAIATGAERRGRMPADTVGARFSSLNSMYYRLVFQDGSGYLFPDGYRQALGRLRLVFESDYQGGVIPSTGVSQSYYKLFEVVAGATLRGKAAPGAEVAISLPLVTGRGRAFTFQGTATADDRGVFAFQVPYATATRQGDTQAGPAYLLSIPGEGARRVRVSEGQVIRGETVTP
jgi:dolichyl-diphosphooligosaccharide--protein glycosyltransferase